MLGLLVAALMAQTPPPVAVQDPFTTAKARVNTSTGGALQVYCVGGTCAGGAGGASTQGLSNDGGYSWHMDLERVAGVAANVGTGAAGTGTLRVATASDSSLSCNAGTNLNTSALALDATLTGGNTKAINRGGAKGATAAADVTSTANGVDHQGLDVQVQNASLTVTGTVTTTPPSNASTNVAQFGGVNVSTGTGASGTGIPRVTIANDSSLAANQSVNMAQVGGTSTVTGGVAGSQGVGGLAASGAAKAGNPVQVGGVFNTVQPTVSTGQAVEAQATARGALIVASGVDAIAVNNTQQGTAAQNVTQFGGTNVSTGTGAAGAGIPRVTISNDSSLAANQSVNVAQINGVAPLMGVGASGTGAQRVAALIHDGTTTAGVIAGTTALKTDLSSVAGTATVTAAAGVAKVGIVGNANAAIDAANNAAAPANVIVDGFEAQSSALGTSATASNVRRAVVGLDGVMWVREGGPLLFTGGVTAIAAALSQVVAAPAASTSLYLTDVMVMSDTATAGNFLIRYGTGSNCATGTTSIYPSAGIAVKSMYPGNASAPLMLNFHTPLKIPAANALCILCVATNTCTAQFWGYTAP